MKVVINMKSSLRSQGSLILLLLLPISASANPLTAIGRHIKHHKMLYTTTAILGVSAALDIRSTEQVFNRCAGCYEANWHLFGGRRPGYGALAANDALLTAPIVLFNWYALRDGGNKAPSDVRFGQVMAGTMTGIFSGWHIYGTIHNNGVGADHVMPGTVRK